MKHLPQLIFISLMLLGCCGLPQPPAPIQTPTPASSPTPTATPTAAAASTQTPATRPIYPPRMSEPEKYLGVWAPFTNETSGLLSQSAYLKSMGANTVTIPVQLVYDEGSVEEKSSAGEVEELVFGFRNESLQTVLVLNPAYPEGDFHESDCSSLDEIGAMAVEWAGKAEEMNVEVFVPLNEPQLVCGDNEAVSQWAQSLLPRIKSVYSGRVGFLAQSYGTPEGASVEEYNLSGYDYVVLGGFGGTSDIDENPGLCPAKIDFTLQELDRVYGWQQRIFIAPTTLTDNEYYWWEPIAPSNMPETSPGMDPGFFVVSEQGQASYFNLFFNKTWNTTKGYLVPQTLGFRFLGKPAEAEVEKWFSSGEELAQQGPTEYYGIVCAGTTGGSSQHAAWFRDSSSRAYELMTDKYDYPEENVYYLLFDDSYDEVDYEATSENFQSAFRQVGARADENDFVFVYLVGHGNHGNNHSFYSLVDGDLRDDSLGSLIDGVNSGRVLVVLTPCNSGGFIDDLSSENTVVLTSTRHDEGNSAGFAEAVLRVFENDNDFDGDGLVTAKDAFEYATDNTQKWYENRGYSTVLEHPLLEDNGDGVGHVAPLPNSGDGSIAVETTLDWVSG